MKISIKGFEARNKAIEGVTYVGDAIKSTIGPFGLNFMLEKGNKLTNDGYLIASELAPTVENEFARRGALVAHEASSKTNDEVGDATSTAWALTMDIIKEAVRYLPSDKIGKAKKQPSEIREQIKQERQQIEEKLQTMIHKIESKEELIQSAMVSVEDENVAKLLGETQWELGPYGRIVVEEVNETECSIEKGIGIRLDNGFGATHFITNQEKGTMELSEIPVFLTNYTIGIEELTKLQELILKDLIAQKKWGIIIIGRAFTADAIKACTESMQSGFPIFPINAPYVDQREVMRDIEAVVGGRYIDSQETSLDEVFLTDVGYIKRIVASMTSAEIGGIEDEKAKERIEKRVATLQEKLKGEKSDFGKRMIEERIAQLTGGFAVLKVGSYSVVERKRLKDKCDDAVHSVRLALQGGTIKGAGIALKEISDTMEDGSILKRPIRGIYDHIISSAPEDWNVPEWVRDPYLSISCALKHACDTASAFATVNGVITEENPQKCKCKQ